MRLSNCTKNEQINNNTTSKNGKKSLKNCAKCTSTNKFSDSLRGGGNSRYIVWDRKRKNHNSPYTFTVKDFEELKRVGETTELCFARKFEEKEDMEIVRKIERWIQDREGTG